MIAYKQFRKAKDGTLHPMFVCTDEAIPIGEWINAHDGPRYDNGMVKSRLGKLSFRPGWHLSEIPYSPHIGIKENGKVKYMKPGTVWTMCMVNDTVNYTKKARKNGVLPNGRVDMRKACLPGIPDDGFYWYNTSPNAFGRWLITDRIFVVKELSDEEVEKICWEQFGIHSQPRLIQKGASS